MPTLLDYILESKNTGHKDIYNACEKIQGKCPAKEARKIYGEMTKFFENSKSLKKDISFDKFKKDRKDESYYLIFDNDNMLMCYWDFNTFKSSTIQIEGNDAWVNGNLYYQSREIDRFINNYIEKPTIWKTK